MKKALKKASTCGAGTVLLSPKGVLLVRLGYGPAKDSWILPGGLIEQNESPSQAALREMREETGAAVKAQGLVCVRHKWTGPLRFDTYFVFASITKTVPRISSKAASILGGEVLEAAWWDVKKALRSRRVRSMTRNMIAEALRLKGRFLKIVRKKKMEMYFGG